MNWQPPTEAEFNDWATPTESLGVMGHRIEGHEQKREIMELLKAGMITAVARSGQPDPRSKDLRQFVPVPPNLWDLWDDVGDSLFWERGLAVFKVYTPTDGPMGWNVHSPQRFVDVRFDPQSFTGRPQEQPIPEQPIAAPTFTEPAGKMAGFLGPRLQDRGSAAPAVAPSAAPSPPSPRRRVGRPSKEYWEELLVEIMRQIWVGDLKPRKQADVQHAMAEWIVTKGHNEPAKTQLKERARLIFQAYEREQE